MKNWIVATLLSWVPLLALGATGEAVIYEVNGQPY